MMGGLLLAAMAGAGAASLPPAAAPYSALAEAAAYCELRIDQANSRFTLPRGTIVYTAMNPVVAQSVRARGAQLGPINAELPDLVKRFAATQPMAQRSGVGPEWFEYVRFGHDGSYAWTVTDPKAAACDVLVTDTDKPLAERDALVAKYQQAGWTLDQSVPGPALWVMSFAKGSASTGASKFVARMQGLGANADKTGVQMEIQFMALAKN